MRTSTLFAFLVFPLLASSQSSSQASQSQSVQLSTSFSTGVTLGPNRQESTVVASVVFTITPSPPAPTGNSTASGNNTVSSNSTVSGNSTASGNVTSTTKSTSASPLPTAPTNVDGGGGPNGAPSPGMTGAGSDYGPDDGYIAGALALKRNAMLVGVVGVVVGAALVFV